jgi:adenosylhomocysteine nucleosidase
MVIRYLLQSWLEAAVRRRLQEALMQAAAQRGTEQSSCQSQPDQSQPNQSQRADTAGESEPSIDRAHVGVVFALGLEAGGLEDMLSGVVTIRGYGFALREGGLKGRRVLVACSGPGKARAAKVTEALIAGHRPLWVISAGFAGGLDPKLRRGDLLIVEQVVDASGQQIDVDIGLDHAALGESSGVHAGRLLTVDRVVRRPEEKRQLAERFQAAAVDMESFAVAEVCRRHDVHFLGVRAVTDTVDDPLPADVERLLHQRSGAARLGAALSTLLNRPGSAKDMWQLHQRAVVASDRLAKFIAGLVEQLAPESRK